MDGRLRSILATPVAAVIIGLVVGGTLTMLVEALGQMVFGVTDPTQPEAISDFSYGVVLVAWTIGAASAGTVAGYLTHAKRPWIGVVAGTITLAAAAFNMVAFPHPVWMMVLSPLLLPTTGAVGAYWGGGKRSAT